MLAPGSQMPSEYAYSAFRAITIVVLRFGVVLLHMSLFKSDRSLAFMHCIHPLEFNEKSVALCEVWDTARSLCLLSK